MKHNVSWAEAYLHIKWHRDPSSRLATINIGRKVGAVPLIHSVVWPQQTGQKVGGYAPFFGGGAGSPSSTVWPGPRPTSMIPSDILLHSAIWRQ